MNNEQKSKNQSQIHQEGVRAKRRRYPWTQQENKQYFKFLSENHQIVGRKDRLEKKSIYNVMSALVKTRSNRQCKSHHQKFMDKYETIQNILIKLPKQIEKSPETNKMQENKQIIINDTKQEKKYNKQGNDNNEKNQRLMKDCMQIQITNCQIDKNEYRERKYMKNENQHKQNNKKLENQTIDQINSEINRYQEEGKRLQNWEMYENDSIGQYFSLGESYDYI